MDVIDDLLKFDKTDLEKTTMLCESYIDACENLFEKDDTYEEFAERIDEQLKAGIDTNWYGFGTAFEGVMVDETIETLKACEEFKELGVVFSKEPVQDAFRSRSHIRQQDGIVAEFRGVRCEDGNELEKVIKKELAKDIAPLIAQTVGEGKHYKTEWVEEDLSSYCFKDDASNARTPIYTASDIMQSLKDGQLNERIEDYVTKYAKTKKSLFGVTEGIICQQCNCRGAYGAGLSGAIAEQFPEVFEAFQQFNKENPLPEQQHGKAQIIALTEGNNSLAVANIFTQKDYGNSAKTGVVYTDTDKLIKNIKAIAETYKVPVYVPHSVDQNGKHSGIGCGLAGGNWEEIHSRLQDLKLDNIYLLDTFSGEKEKVQPKTEEKKKNVNYER